MIISDLIDLYIANDEFALSMATAQHMPVSNYLYLNLMSSLEEGTLVDDWSDLYTSEQLSFLLNNLE